MQLKIEGIMIIQESILYYGDQVINMVGMSEIDDICELILQLLNKHLFMQWLIEKLLLQKIW